MSNLEKNKICVFLVSNQQFCQGVGEGQRKRCLIKYCGGGGAKHFNYATIYRTKIREQTDTIQVNGTD